jgi:hypothetical protein
MITTNLEKSSGCKEMTKTDYEQLKLQAEERYQTALAEYRQNIEAIERVWRLVQSQSYVATETDGIDEEILEETDSRFSRGELLDLVREAAIAHENALFSVLDIHDVLVGNNPEIDAKEFRRPSIAAALKRLEQLGEIRTEHQGAGRRATEYANVQNKESNEN